MRPVPLSRRRRPAVPVDLALSLLPSRAAVGVGRDAAVGLRPAPGRRFWVGAMALRGAGYRWSSRPRPLFAALAFLARFGIDPHRLEWEPRRHAETPTNPFAE